MAHIKERGGSGEVSEEVCLPWCGSPCVVESASLRFRSSKWEYVCRSGPGGTPKGVQRFRAVTLCLR